MIKAVIFDMDGVISDTQKLHAEADSEVLKKFFKIDITAEEVTRRFAGKSEEAMFGELLGQAGRVYDHNLAQQASQEKWIILGHLAEKKGIDAVAGALELIEHLTAEKFLLAVASASRKSFIKKVVRTLQIENKFQILVSAEEVTNGKPAPDIFLHAAQQLQVSPQNCLVIEDGRSGMLGAKAAKMLCIGLVTEIDYDYWPADHLVRSLGEINSGGIADLQSLERPPSECSASRCPSSEFVQ